MKAILFGLGLSVLGTSLYLLGIAIWFYRRSRPPVTQGQTGIDVISLARSALHNPVFWVLAVGLLFTGYAVFTMWPRPIY